MQKNLLMLCALLLTISSYAQILFEQDFSDGIAPMTMVNNDGKTPAANVGSYTDAWNIREYQAGDNAAISVSWYSPPAAADDWLITPALTIDEEGYLFTWDAVAIDASYADGYEVLVSTTDTELTSFTAVFSVASEVTGGLKKRAIGLDDYVGQTIYVAIRNNSFDKFLLVVDNIKVEKYNKFDVASVRLNNYRWQLKGSDVFPSFTIANNGTETINSLDVNYTINGTNTVKSFTGLNLGVLEEIELISDEAFNVSDATQYDVAYTVENLNNGNTDADVSDNTGSGAVNGIESAPNRKIVVEEGTGTWCGWCPRGHVFMGLMAEKYPEDFIGIAVHNGDVMTLPEHDTESAFSGYPGAHVNRSILGINPANAETYYLSEKDVVVPFVADMDLDFNEATGLVSITAKAIPATSITGGDFRFAVIITEDEVTGTTAQYNQVNYYSGGGQGVMGGYELLPDPVPAADMVYEDVSRALVGGYYGEPGSIASSLTQGTEVTKAFTYTLPAGANPEHFKAAVLILDTQTGAILNADEEYVRTPVGIFETALENLDATIYPNPATDLAIVEVNLEEAANVTINVVDMAGRTVSSTNYGQAQGNQTFEINVADLNAGVYLVNINTENGISTKRLTVAK